MTAAATELVALDMAGTTVADDGLVERAFLEALDHTAALDAVGEAAAREYVRATMGESKIDCFLGLLRDPQRAHAANAEFENAYARLAGTVGVRALAGAEELLRDLRAAGIRTCLTTGFSPATREAILDDLGWDPLVDLALSPADAGGRGRPHPDMLLTAALRLRVVDLGNVVVVGDTTSDLLAGSRARAGEVVGVLTGAHDRQTLGTAPHTRIVESVADVREIIIWR
jgi:phosphoglycolate phosphatase